ncbi:hypothetical protein AB0M68_03685 [Streptomyces sp. NPDC051453]|uniref:hypothetical protein n=1 Tax=Streptomyces sp. NPDC051453 TaxID=3154941 RepID=UPI00342244A7
MNRRTVAWLLLTVFLITVGLWPAAAAPIVLVTTGAAVIVAKAPLFVLAAGLAVHFWRRRTHPVTRTANA